MENTNLRVSLLTSASAIDAMIHNAAYAGFICTGRTEKINAPNFDKCAFLARRIDDGHESVIEHIYLTFLINGLSRACLQELARHRHVSLSVESTRWTLKKTLLSDDPMIRWNVCTNLTRTFEKRIYDSIPDDHTELRKKLDKMRNAIDDVFKTAANDENRDVATADVMKYFLPECMQTKLIMTCNLRELRHIYKLRSQPPALREFQDLCAAIRDALPDDLMALLLREPVVKRGVTA